MQQFGMNLVSGLARNMAGMLPQQQSGQMGGGTGYAEDSLRQLGNLGGGTGFGMNFARALLGGIRRQYPQQSATPGASVQQSQAPVQPQVPARPLVGAPRQWMGKAQPMPNLPMQQPMGQPTSSRPLVGTPRLQQQATVNALRAPVPTV